MNRKSAALPPSKRTSMARWVRHVTGFDTEVYSRHVAGKKAETAVLAKAASKDFRGLSDSEFGKLEAIITTGRPVVVVQNGAVDGSGSGAEWAGRISDASAVIEAVMPSVGRIEMRGAALNLGQSEFSDQMIGTGFVVARNVIVTNRHVAEVFCREDGTVRQNLDPRIDFVEEFKRDPDQEVRIVRALEIGVDYDYAILELEGGASVPRPLPLRSTMPEAQDMPLVFAAGYPAFDDRNPTNVQRDIFGGLFEVKRFAPGRLRRTVTNRGLTLLEGDYTTLGGNSGSPIFDFETGEVVALHFAGAYLEGNYSVPMAVLQPRIAAAVRGLGVEGSRRAGIGGLEALAAIERRLAAMEAMVFLGGSEDVRQRTVNEGPTTDLPVGSHSSDLTEIVDVLVQELGGTSATPLAAFFPTSAGLRTFLESFVARRTWNGRRVFLNPGDITPRTVAGLARAVQAQALV